MASIQNLTRKQGTYYFRKLVRIGRDQPFRLRLSLKTTNIRQARRRASVLTLLCESHAMAIMVDPQNDGLTAQQRAEIFRRQILIERDRLEVCTPSCRSFHPPITMTSTKLLPCASMQASSPQLTGSERAGSTTSSSLGSITRTTMIRSWSWPGLILPPRLRRRAPTRLHQLVLPRLGSDIPICAPRWPVKSSIRLGSKPFASSGRS